MSDETPKLRLKPRLAPDDPTPNTSLPSPTLTPSPVETSSPSAPIVDAPSSSVPEAAPEEPAPPPTIRFKPRPTPAAAPSEVAPLPPPLVAPPPVVPMSDAPGAVAIARKDTPVAADIARSERVAVTARANRKLKTIAAGLVIGGLMVFSALGYIAYRRFRVLQRDNALAQARAAKAETSKSSETKRAPSAAAVGAAAVSLPTESVVKPASASTGAPPADAIPTASSVAATSTASAPPPAPDPAAIAWVQSLKIAGLRKGASPRILVERATYSVGDTLNAELGVTFAGYDASRRMLEFKDRNGTLIERRERN